MTSGDVEELSGGLRYGGPDQRGIYGSDAFALSARETPLFTIPFRTALDVFVQADDGVLNGATMRVYAVNRAVKTIVGAVQFLETQPAVNGRVAAVRGGCESWIITIEGRVNPRKVTVSVAGYGFEPQKQEFVDLLAASDPYGSLAKNPPYFQSYDFTENAFGFPRIRTHGSWQCGASGSNVRRVEGVNTATALRFIAIGECTDTPGNPDFTLLHGCAVPPRSNFALDFREVAAQNAQTTFDGLFVNDDKFPWILVCSDLEDPVGSVLASNGVFLACEAWSTPLT